MGMYDSFRQLENYALVEKFMNGCLGCDLSENS